MVTGEDGISQVIEATVAGPALVALPLRLGLIPALFDNLAGVATGASDTVGPVEVTDHLVALGVVGDPQDVDEHSGRLHAERKRSDILIDLDYRLDVHPPHSSP